MKRKILHLLEAVGFCLFLAIVIAGLSGVLERKESSARLDPFFERADDIDVLFLGNSHLLNAVFPMELWDDYGIAAYNLANYNNTIPLSYWVLQCALESCTPKMVVVDVYYVGQSGKLSESSGDVHTALDGFPMSVTKLRAIQDLTSDRDAMDAYGNRYIDLKYEYFFPLALYHARWESLTRDDFKPEKNQQLGAQMAINVAQPAEYDIIASAGDEEGWGFVYLRKIIEECQARGIDVLLVNAPYPPAGENDQYESNAVYYLAEECGVEYIDFVYMDQIVDYSTDCYDPSSHLNPSGARKVTDYLGQYIADAYDMPDHRLEERYAAWNEDYSTYVDLKLQTFREQFDLGCFFMLLHDDDFSVCISIPEGSALYGDEGLKQLLQNIGRRHLFEEDTYESVWADGLFPLERLEEAAEQGKAYLAVIDRGQNTISEVVGNVETDIDASFGPIKYGADGDLRMLSIDGKTCFDGGSKDEQIRIAVIDERTGDVVMTREFDVW